MQNSTPNDTVETRNQPACKRSLDTAVQTHKLLSRALLDSMAWDSRQRARRKRLGLA